MLRQKWPPVFARDHNSPNVRLPLWRRVPRIGVDVEDIYNARARINRDKLNGHSPTAALIKLFDEKEIPYFVKWADDEPNRLVGLVWTFPYCLQMWKRFPEVISFDNTYNTNRFKLPLLQATGQTCFLSESIRQLLEQHSIRQRDVIITDFDEQMKAALDDQFPAIDMTGRWRFCRRLLKCAYARK
ncbi:HEC/Ndc80p family protein [Purpureocillium lavendulum]|uniref:HEC/Ndc80p family protein n=1 Tax=Purpureocillium lavendulum TaxID=1247861 RepID=A0AB34FF86_9HYPO|nr:HEC/Ndc80p family protein [Purpureocillium lavendulum]